MLFAKREIRKEPFSPGWDGPRRPCKFNLDYQPGKETQTHDQAQPTGMLHELVGANSDIRES